MKKLNFFNISIFFVCLFLFPCCGLEEYYVLEAPYQKFSSPDASTGSSGLDFTGTYFGFYTNDSDNSTSSASAFKYMGTAVYYKIYNNYSTMNSQISAVSSISSSTNYSSAFPRLQSYGYQELGVEGRNVSPLIPASGGKNQKVFIRITNYQEPAKNSDKWKDYAYRAKIVVDNDEKYIPMRQDNTKSFDFGRKNSNGDYDKPKSGEDDVNYSSTASEDDIYYVALYAVAVGYDNSFTNYYSNVLYLGSVPINAAEEDN